jgi:hypothetical protein
MWHLLKFATIFFRCIPAFFRSRSSQAVVELALRQQLATFAEKGRRPRVHTELQDSPMGRPTEHRPSLEAQVV